jgi:alpha-tubulin suppressor-like RCC1 family protein
MCWGSNAAGQLGVGDTANRLTPTDVPLRGGAAARFIAAGVSHTCVVTTTAGLQCWGSNASAQLGLPSSTTPLALAPVEVPNVTGVNTVAAGAGHTCVLLAGSGAVACWGANEKGQVGQNPATAVVTVPTTVNLGGAATQLAAQVDHTCAIKAASGQVSCWGANSLGQCGQSASPTTPGAPGAIVSSLTATALAVGGAHTCSIGFVNNVPGVYCWGDRAAGQLGSGSSGFTSTPVLAANIAPGSGPADLVLTGLAHTCDARGADGTVTCSGADLSLQAGQAPPTSSVARGPAIVVGSAIDALFGAGDRSCALAAGRLACWGANEEGQLGDGSAADSATPVGPQGY